MKNKTHELFPFLRRNQLGTLTLCGVDKSKAPDGHVPNFHSADRALTWGILFGVLDKNTKLKDLQVRK